MKDEVFYYTWFLRTLTAARQWQQEPRRRRHEWQFCYLHECSMFNAFCQWSQSWEVNDFIIKKVAFKLDTCIIFPFIITSVVVVHDKVFCYNLQLSFFRYFVFVFFISTLQGYKYCNQFEGRKLLSVFKVLYMHEKNLPSLSRFFLLYCCSRIFYFSRNFVLWF